MGKQKTCQCCALVRHLLDRLGRLPKQEDEGFRRLYHLSQIYGLVKVSAHPTTPEEEADE